MAKLEDSIQHKKMLAAIEADKQGLQQPLIDPVQLLAGGIAGGVRSAAMRGAAPVGQAYLNVGLPAEQSATVQAYMKWRALMEATHGKMIYGK